MSSEQMDHTPGRWVWDEDGNTLRNHNGDFVLWFGGNGEAGGTEPGNARLIAAAPELLAALYSVTDAAEYMEFDPDSRFGEAMQRVIAAIAKATRAAAQLAKGEGN